MLVGGRYEIPLNASMGRCGMVVRQFKQVCGFRLEGRWAHLGITGHSDLAGCNGVEVLPTKGASVLVQAGNPIGTGAIVFVVQDAVLQLGSLG